MLRSLHSTSPDKLPSLPIGNPKLRRAGTSELDADGVRAAVSDVKVRKTGGRSESTVR